VIRVQPDPQSLPPEAFSAAASLIPPDQLAPNPSASEIVALAARLSLKQHVVQFRRIQSRRLQLRFFNSTVPFHCSPEILLQFKSIAVATPPLSSNRDSTCAHGRGCLEKILHFVEPSLDPQITVARREIVHKSQLDRICRSAAVRPFAAGFSDFTGGAASFAGGPSATRTGSTLNFSPRISPRTSPIRTGCWNPGSRKLPPSLAIRAPPIATAIHV